jgi:protein-S-isoprenylcysteine O-methyltransferase Ste14
MGERGGGWVVGQFVLMGAIVLSPLVAPGWPDEAITPLRVVALVLLAAGVLVVWWAARTMGRSLTAFPEPAAGAELVESGPFARVRHPVYAGALLVFLGISLATGPLALALTGALAGLWVGKMRAEEARLRRRFPGYDAYAERVRRRLVPGVW